MRKRFFLLALFLALALPVLSFATDGENSSLNVCDHNGDTLRNLTDVSLYASCVDTFDANGDGVHDLSDISLYASNNQNNTWCQTNFNCSAPVMINSSYISSTNSAGLAVCDHNGDGLRNLTDVSLYASCVGTFDANGDGVHDLSDISLYASNNQDNTWCQANFRCTPSSGVDLTITNITNYPVIPKVGEDTYITLHILNSGNAILTSTAGILNNFRYFQDFSTGMLPNVIPSVSPTNPLNPGESTYIVWKGNFTSAGTKSLQATVDNANELAETNENNNNYNTTINVSSANAYAVCDLNNDGVSNLSDVSLFTNCQSTFDVNGDGVHNLTDISLYSSNYQSSSWCRANFVCRPSSNDNYPGFGMSLDKVSYAIEDTAMLTLRSYNSVIPYNVDLYGKFNAVGENSKTFLIQSDITVGSSLVVPVDLDGFATSDDKKYEYSLLICSSANGCVMGSTNSVMINIKTVDTDDNDDLPTIDKSLDKVKVCHVTGNTKNQTLEISKDALAAHLAHGDKAGACDLIYYHPSDVNSLLTNLKQNRNTAEEARFKKLALADANEFGVKVSDKDLDLSATFITYGIDDVTKNAGSGQRRAVVRNYWDAIGYPDINWEDVVRLTNGEIPVRRNLAKEQAKVAEALKYFEAIYGQRPNFKLANHNLAWNTLMYRISFDNRRDLKKEAKGIEKYKEVFSSNPELPVQWAAVYVWAYIEEI